MQPDAKRSSRYHPKDDSFHLKACPEVLIALQLAYDYIFLITRICSGGLWRPSPLLRHYDVVVFFR